MDGGADPNPDGAVDPNPDGPVDPNPDGAVDPNPDDSGDPKPIPDDAAPKEDVCCPGLFNSAICGKNK